MFEITEIPKSKFSKHLSLYEQLEKLKPGEALKMTTKELISARPGASTWVRKHIKNAVLSTSKKVDDTEQCARMWVTHE